MGWKRGGAATAQPLRACDTRYATLTTAASVQCSSAPHRVRVELGAPVQDRQLHGSRDPSWWDLSREISASTACMMGSRALLSGVSSSAGGIELAGTAGASASSRCSMS